MDAAEILVVSSRGKGPAAGQGHQIRERRRSRADDRVPAASSFLPGHGSANFDSCFRRAAGIVFPFAAVCALDGSCHRAASAAAIVAAAVMTTATPTVTGTRHALRQRERQLTAPNDKQ